MEQQKTNSRREQKDRRRQSSMQREMCRPKCGYKPEKHAVTWNYYEKENKQAETSDKNGATPSLYLYNREFTAALFATDFCDAYYTLQTDCSFLQLDVTNIAEKWSLSEIA